MKHWYICLLVLLMMLCILLALSSTGRIVLSSGRHKVYLPE